MKKILAGILSFSLCATFLSSSVLAEERRNTRSNNIRKNLVEQDEYEVIYSFDYSNKDKANSQLFSKGLIKINVSEDEIFRELGILNIVQAKKKELADQGTILEKMEIILPKDEYNGIIESQKQPFFARGEHETNLGTVNDGTYNGYKIRHVILRSVVKHDLVEFKNSYIGRELSDVYSKGFNIVIGLTKKRFWIPATILGLDFSIFESYKSRRYEDVQDSTIHGELYTHIYQIEDKDNKYKGYDYYPFVTTEKENMTIYNRFFGRTKDNRMIKYDWNQKLISYAKYYWDKSFLKKRTYQGYMGMGLYNDVADVPNLEPCD